MSFKMKKFLQDNIRKRTATPDTKACVPQLKKEGNPDMNFFDDVNKARVVVLSSNKAIFILRQ